MREASHLERRRAPLGGLVVGALGGDALEERIVDDVGVGLHVAGEALEHVPDREARVLRLEVEEDVVFVRQSHEEVPLATGLTLAVLERRRLDGHARRVGRQAERRRDRLLARRLDDAAERCPDVLGVAPHRRAIEREPLGGAVLFVPVERHSEHVLHGQEPRDHRRREHAARRDLPRKRCGHRPELLRVRHVRGPPIGSVGRVVDDARDDESTVAATLVRDARAFVGADAVRLALELGIGELDANDRKQACLEIASTRRRISGPLPPLLLIYLVGRRRVGGSRIAARRVEDLLDRLRLREEPVEGELRVGDIVKALGLRDNEAPLEQMQLLEQLVISHPKVCEGPFRARQLAAQRGVVATQKRHLGDERADTLIALRRLRLRRVHRAIV